MSKLGRDIINSLRDAEAKMARYIACKARGHQWSQYVPIKGKPLLRRTCKACGVTELNTR